MREYSIEELIEIGKWIFQADPITLPTSPTQGLVDFRQFNDVVVSSVHLPPFRLSHSPKRLRDVDNEYLLFEIVDAGGKRGIAGEVYVEQGPANVHLIDMSQKYQCVLDETVGWGIHIPHHVVDFDPSNHPRYVSYPTNSDRGRLLYFAAKTFAKCVFTQANPEETSTFRAIFLSLVRSLALNDRNTKSRITPRQTLLFAKSVIEENLTNPNLSPDFLASRLGLSRASIYRLFSDEGGIARYITERRLQNAFADLVGATAERGAVRRTAQHWGFDDPSNFNRRFRDRFGVSPSDCLMGHIADSANDTKGVWHPVFNWMAKKGQHSLETE